MIDLLLDPSGRLADVPANTHQVFAIVRLGGVPIGYCEHVDPASNVRHTLIERHEHALVDHLLRRALIEGTFASREEGSLSSASAHTRAAGTASFTVAVCTRDRQDDLARCLASIERLEYPGALEILVVENAPQTTAVADLIRTSHPRVRYVQELCPGLNWARRRAVTEATGDIIGFVDDDVTVDEEWASSIGVLMADHQEVMAVTGLVVPFELETEAQVRFERLGGLGKGFVRRWHRRRHGQLTAPAYGNMGPLGIGANMAFRRAIFDEVGSFDPALGAGTATGGGDDLDLLFRVLKAGHTVVYEPAAFVRHRHRRDDAALESQMRSWCTGMQAFLTRSMRAYPDERSALMMLAARLLLLYYPGRLLRSITDPWLRPRLAAAEIVGALRGLRCYGPARQRAEALAIEFSKTVEDPATHGHTPLAAPVRMMRTVELNLDAPLPAVLPGPNDSDRVFVKVMARGRYLGTLTVVCGGQPIGRLRIADELVTTLGRALLDPEDRFDRAVRHALMTSSTPRSRRPEA